MSEKVAATLHAESLPDRLRRYAVGSDNSVVMNEAADYIEAKETLARDHVKGTDQVDAAGLAHIASCGVCTLRFNRSGRVGR